VTRQLDDGIRLLQSQGHNSTTGTVDGGIELCHTSCEIFDAGTLLSYLQKVKSWLDSNPDEVLTILFTNSDGIDITIWGADFASAGLDTLAYVPSFTTTPSATSAWPTLESLISSGKRVIIFLDAGADTSQVPYILPEFTYIWETAFDQTDPSFPCAVNRPSSIANQIPTGRMSLVNHFLDTTLTAGVLIPDTAQLNVTNAVSGVGSLGLNADTCAAMYGAYPNFLLVDYYDVSNGSVFQVAAKLNDVPYIAMGTLTTNSNTTTASNVPSAAAAKKVLPAFIILQLLLSTFVLGGAAWLAMGDDLNKYNRLQDRYSTLIPATGTARTTHKPQISIASVGPAELERGPLIGERRDSIAELVSHGAVMESDTPRHSESSDDLAEVGGSAVRPVSFASTGYFERRQSELWI